MKNEFDRLENEHLNSIKLREEEVNAALRNSALEQERELERSRRQKESLYRE